MRNPLAFCLGFGLLMTLGICFIEAMRGRFDASKIHLPGTTSELQAMLLIAIVMMFSTYMIFLGIHG